MMTMQGSEMRAIRQSIGLSQEVFATGIGMSRKAINEMEAGRAPVEKRTAMAVRQFQNERARIYSNHRVAEMDDDIPLEFATVLWEREDSIEPALKVVDSRLGIDDQRYSSSWGTSNADFLERDGVGKLLMLLSHFVEWTAIDRLSPRKVHKALSVIPEYRWALDYGFFREGVVHPGEE